MNGLVRLRMNGLVSFDKLRMNDRIGMNGLVTSDRPRTNGLLKLGASPVLDTGMGVKP